MRILDRYIAWTFLAPLLVSLAAVTGLYIVAHAFGNLNDYIQEAGNLGDALNRMARIYLLRIPTFIVPVLPVAMLVGAAYGVSLLAAKNELTAMRSCGISLWRILAPVYGAAVFVSVLGLANREYVIPRIEAMTAHDLKEWTGEDEFKPVAVFKPEEDGAFYNVSYNVVKGEARGFTIVLPETGEHYVAKTARWEDGVWRLKDVTRGEKLIDHMTWETSLNPQELELRLMDPDHASLKDLRRLISMQSADRETSRNRYTLLYHKRLAYAFEGLVLVAIGLPLVIGNERIRRSRMLGVGLCVAVSGVFYTVQFVATDLGMVGHLPPVVAAWLPLIIFAALGLYLIEVSET